METLGKEHWENLVAEAENRWVFPVMIAARMKRLFPNLGFPEAFSANDAPNLIALLGPNLSIEQGQVLSKSLANFEAGCDRASESYEDGI